MNVADKAKVSLVSHIKMIYSLALTIFFFIVAEGKKMADNLF